MIGIVDIGLCNLRSVEKAVFSLGHDVRLVREPTAIDGDVTHAILPGVGNFRAAMQRLRERGLADALVRFASGESGRPLLGICLGMQLLATFGEEGGGSEGLGLIDGRVVRLSPGGKFRVPHVGWNTVDVVPARRAHVLFDGVKPRRDFYFVHSYHFVADRPADVLSTTEYGGNDFISAVARANVIGVQFHPEKSQKNGVRMLENFCASTAASVAAC